MNKLIYDMRPEFMLNEHFMYWVIKNNISHLFVLMDKLVPTHNIPSDFDKDLIVLLYD